MVGNGTFPPLFTAGFDCFFLGKVIWCLQACSTCNAMPMLLPETHAWAPQKAEFCRAGMTPKLYHPQIFPGHSKSKNRIWQNQTFGWRGPVGNSSALIHNRIPGRRRSVLWGLATRLCLPWHRLYFSSDGICFGREHAKVAHVNEKLYILTQGSSSCRFVDWGTWPQSCAPEPERKRMLLCLPFIISALPSSSGICSLLPAVS